MIKVMFHLISINNSLVSFTMSLASCGANANSFSIIFNLGGCGGLVGIDFGSFSLWEVVVS